MHDEVCNVFNSELAAEADDPLKMALVYIVDYITKNTPLLSQNILIKLVCTIS